MFRNPVDIANRALQHCGAARISNTQGFNEDSKNASETGFIYDKVRRAELRRNVWRFSVRHAVLRPIDTTSRLLAAPLWSSSTTYTFGSIVSDALGQMWMSLAPQNLNNEPGNAAVWELYFGPLAIPPWDSTTAYYAGDIVYVTPGNGTVKVYQSLIAGNEDTPGTVTPFDADDTYQIDDIVVSAAVNYQSLIDFNVGNTPSATTAPALWDSGTTYALAARVRGSDGYMYLAAVGSNTGNDPVGDGGTHWTNTGVLAAWTATLTRTASSTNWLYLDNATLARLPLVYPIGSGPVTDQVTRNVYRLPAGYLREAPQDPKAGSVSFLGAPTGLPYMDWTFEGNYIVTRCAQPIKFRFAADVTDVRNFDDMFCEGLAARIGLSVCLPLTQSTEKENTLASIYQKFISEARIVNGIETGATEPAEDDYVSCRA